MILGSGIGSVITPFAQAFAWLLAGYYSFTHDYGLSIILLTLTVMVVVFPLTRRGTRSMMRMQLLAPELQKIRERYKKDKGQSVQERQEAQKQLNEEMMALYRENGVSPTGGCLPTFLQFPIFIVLYDVIRGMTRTKTVGKRVVSIPEYVNKSTALYHALSHSGGKLFSFGLNLADSVRTHQPSFVDVIPYIIVILIAVALQYVSIWQITNRNPAAAQANPQMQSVQKFMPIIFVFLYIVLPAGVGIYFIVSSLFRVAQQEYMYKHDKQIVATVAQLRERKPAPGTTVPGEKKGFLAQLRELSGSPATTPALESAQTTKAGGGSGGGSAQGGGTGNRPGAKGSAGSKPANRPDQTTAAGNGQPQPASTPAKASKQTTRAPGSTYGAATVGARSARSQPRSNAKRRRRHR